IVWSRCAPCHRPGEVGPFSLITFDDVRRRLTAIDEVTRKAIMPPWKPTAGKGEFADARRLRPDEQTKLQRWIAQGAPEGNAPDRRPAAEWTTPWRLGPPDLIVTMPSAYTVRADASDVFRTFVVPIATTRARYVRALEFRPDNARLVHHANVGIDRTRSSR